jgi:hypothetical protein
MSKVHETPEDLPVPPACRATVELLQRALDGEAAPEALDADPHPTACAACRERLRAARVLMSVLALPPEPVVVPAGFTDRVLAAVAADRSTEPRGDARKDRGTRVSAWVALAAAIVVGMFYLSSREHKPDAPTPGPVETARPEVAPAPREKLPTPEPNPAPEPRPIRIGDEFAKAGEALRDAPKPITESVAVAPKIIDVFTGPFKMPGAPPEPNPMATALEPARKSIAEIPVAARTGLEPVTDTAEKAFNRFLRDMGAVKPNS